MDTTNFLIENKVKFLTNAGDYNEQPVFVLVTNKSLTGNEFVAISRIVKEKNEAASGLLSFHWGTSANLNSTTGSKELLPESITGGIGTAANTTTASQNQYTISTVITKSNRVDVIIKDNNINVGDISITGLTKINNDLNYIGTGFRPAPEQTPPDGTTGKSQVLLYTYNRQELSSQITGIEDRSNNSISADIKGTASGDGTSATITGFTYSPCDGGFRLDGTSWIESLSSHHFNASTANGFSVMTHIKLAATGNTNILSVGSSGTEVISLKEESGTVRLKVGASSVTAGFMDIGRWYHIGAVVHNTTGSESGGFVYINGNSASFSASINSFPAVNSDTRLLIGKDLDLASSGITGTVGMTRIFNRPLSANEMMMNYLGTIPSMAIHDSLKIG